MKKLLMFSAAFVLTLTASAAAAAPSGKLTLKSDNVIGIQANNQNANEANIAVAFDAVGGGEISLADTLYLDNLSMADTVSVMQNDSKSTYTQWIWLPGFLTDLYWTARSDAQTAVEASQQMLARGFGIRLALAKKATTVYTLGQYAEPGLSSKFKKGSGSLLVNPYPVSIDLEKEFVGAFKLMDKIYIKSGSEELVYSYTSTADSEGRHWYRPSKEEESGKKFDLDLHLIAPGGSFRFFHGAVGDNELNVTW